MRRFGTVAALALLLGGCVSYAQTNIASLSPQDRVRVQVADSELPRLLHYVNTDSRQVSGTFVEASGDSVTVVLRSPGSFAEVSIPRSGIVLVERGKPDVKRNLLGSALIVGGIAAIAVLGFEGDSKEGIDLGSGTDEMRPPVVRLRFPFAISVGGGR